MTDKIRILFADNTHEDHDAGTTVSEWPDGPQNTLAHCRRDPARLDVWVQRAGEWKAVKIESTREQAWREMYEAEKARADAAEKRLADLRAWADEIAKGQSDSPEGLRVAGDFRAVVYRIDEPEGEP